MSGTASDPRSVAALQTLARLLVVFERNAGELSLAQYRVLSAVAAGDARASRIADKLALGRPAVSATVDALCRRGLLRRSDDPADHRVIVLRLTATGRGSLARAEASLLAVVDDLIRRVDDPDAVLDSLVGLEAALAARRSERDAARDAAAQGRTERAR